MRNSKSRAKKHPAPKRARRPHKPAPVKPRRLAVIGVGNQLMEDDGAGIAALKLLKTKDLPRGADVLDMGTGGMALVHALSRYDAVVIADAVDMGAKPGTVRTFSPDDVVSVKELKRLSLHEGDVFETIVLARRLGQCPGKILICAIQPSRIGPRDRMTEAVQAKLPELAAHMRRAAFLLGGAR